MAVYIATHASFLYSYSMLLKKSMHSHRVSFFPSLLPYAHLCLHRGEKGNAAHIQFGMWMCTYTHIYDINIRIMRTICIHHSNLLTLSRHVHAYTCTPMCMYVLHVHYITLCIACMYLHFTHLFTYRNTCVMCRI